MIKKFEAYNNEDFISFVKEAFIDFIDEDVFELYITKRRRGGVDEKSCKISIRIHLPLESIFKKDSKLNKLSDIQAIIDVHKKQTEMIEEARVAILRIKDEFGIEPIRVNLSGVKQWNEDDFENISHYFFYIEIDYKYEVN